MIRDISLALNSDFMHQIRMFSWNKLQISMLKEKTLLKSGIIKLLKNSKYSFLGLVDFFFWSGELSDFLFVIQCSKSAIYRQCSNKTGNVFFENIKQPLPVCLYQSILEPKNLISFFYRKVGVTVHWLIFCGHER